MPHRSSCLQHGISNGTSESMKTSLRSKFRIHMLKFSCQSGHRLYLSRKRPSSTIPRGSPTAVLSVRIYVEYQSSSQVRGNNPSPAVADSEVFTRSHTTVKPRALGRIVFANTRGSADPTASQVPRLNACWVHLKFQFGIAFPQRR